MTFFKNLLTLFGASIKIDELESKYNGKIRVKKIFNDLYIYTGTFFQSGKLEEQAWSPILEKIAFVQADWLILGLAGGSIPNLIFKKYSPKSVTSVEIDPQMISIWNRYFNKKSVPLKIVNQDAKVFITKNKHLYDLLIEDLYCDNKLPEFVYSDSFIKNAKRSAKTVVFSHVYHTESSINLAQNYVVKLKKYFTTVLPIKSKSVLLIVCS